MKRLVSAVLALALGAGLNAAVKLTGDTNRPDVSIFRKGEPVELLFTISGLEPGKFLTLELNLVDQNDRCLKKESIPVKADANGKWSGKVKAPSALYGFYRMCAKLSNGIVLPAAGSRPAGYLTYAVVPDPAKRKLYSQDDTFFGLHGDSTLAPLAPWLGARWGMRSLPTTPERFREYIAKRPRDWKFYSHIPIREEVYRSWTPEQLKAHTKGKGFRTLFSDAEGEALYKENVRRLVKRGKEQYLFNTSLIYQPAWEPDLYFSDDEIIRVHKAAYEAIHAEDPHTRVIGPTFSSIQQGSIERHRRLFEKGFLNYVDEIGIHPYILYPVEINGLVDNIRLLKKYVKQYAKGRKIPIRGTVSGYERKSGSSAEERIQMYGQVRANLILLGEGFASNDPFYGYDFGQKVHSGGYGLTYNLMTPKQAWNPGKTSPLPVFPALSAMSFLLEGYQSAGAIEFLGNGIFGYRNSNAENHCIIALWDFGGADSIVEFPVGRTEIDVADIMGNRKRAKAADGILKIALSEAPVYLIGVAPGLWGKNAARPVQPAEREISAIVGTEAAIKGLIRTEKAFSGEIRLVFPETMNMAALSRNISAPSGKDVSFQFRFTVSETLRTGSYPLILKLVSNGRTIAADGMLLQVNAPLDMEKTVPVFEHGIPGIRVTLKNRMNQPSSGVLETRIPGYPEARRNIRFSLKPRERKSVDVLFNGLDVSPFKNLNVKNSVTLTSGYQFASEKTLNFLSASCLPGVGTNGDFSAWREPARYRIDPDAVVRSAGYHNGEKDLSASLAFGWNDQYLLFDVEVFDDVFHQPYMGSLTWAGDSLQLGLAKRRTTPATANALADQSELAYSEIDFALTRNGPEVFRTCSFDPDRFPCGLIEAKTLPFCVKKTLQPNGLICLHYQIAVPWSFLNLSRIRAGDTVYFSLTVNDRDSSGKGKQSDPSALGVFQLKNAAPRFFCGITLDAPAKR